MRRRRLAYVNRAWEELTGLAAGREAVGKPCHPHGPTGTPPDTVSGLLGSFCPPPEAIAGQPASAPTLIVHPGGERLWRRLEFWPFHNARGKLVLPARPRAARPTRPLHAPEAESQRLRVELMEVREPAAGAPRVRRPDRARGPAHRRLLDQVDMAAAATDRPVLIVGRARAPASTAGGPDHPRAARPRASAPLVPLDCAALAPADLELALFGPTPDWRDAPAPRLDLPAGASLLLDNVLDLPRDLQGRLAAGPGLGCPAPGHDRRRRGPAPCLEDRLRPDLYLRPDRPGPVTCSPAPRAARRAAGCWPSTSWSGRTSAAPASGTGFTPEALAALLAYDWPGNQA